ncbi:MAG TPA: AbrB/MazE/SpoVT family DNA-binding domain-containing protein [Solirubrobacterales bacterium]|nr:AbrB/MazE/SpoVT family DNA-binding domain-containing protein [Solirubrobacterales bacterium]
MTHKVGVKGQVVIAKAIRDQIGIRPGDEIAFDLWSQELDPTEQCRRDVLRPSDDPPVGRA